MNRYTIYCTEEQTRKALELGAPIENLENIKGRYESTLDSFLIDNIVYIKPTAEQMIGWLEGQRLGIDICRDNNGYEWSVWVRKDFPFFVGNDCFLDTRTEATLAAIDAALEYLTKKGE